MTLANMRAQGVRSLWVVCELYHHEARAQCGRLWRCRAGACFQSAHGMHVMRLIGAHARPNWQERAPHESLTGRQWHC
jgi:hypothetical protein